MRMPAASRALMLMLLAAGCSSQPVKHDIGFVRGCWVEKAGPDGPYVAFLRLLPDRDGAPALTGMLDYLELEAGNGVSGDERDDMIYTLANDGSLLTIDVARESGYRDQATRETTEPQTWTATTVPPLAEEQRLEGESLAAFRKDDTGEWTIVAGAAEHLAIYTLHPDGGMGSTVFYGERDGCD
jgi:hypothetical protein